MQTCLFDEAYAITFELFEAIFGKESPYLQLFIKVVVQ